MGELSPPPVKRRIAPPPPESFMNQDRHSGLSNNDYNRPYYGPSGTRGYDAVGFDLGSSDRLHYDGSRGDWEEYSRKNSYNCTTSMDEVLSAYHFHDTLKFTNR